MKKTKSQILKECHLLVKDLELLTKKREEDRNNFNLSKEDRDVAFGKVIAYQLAAKWLEEIVGKEGEG